MLLELPRTRYPARAVATAALAYAPKVALVAILCLAAILRLTGRNWDEGRYLHPDERFITMVATGISWPSSVGQYFDSATSPLNPYNNEFGSYVYGTFPLFLAKLTGNVLGNNVYGDFHLAGRGLSAVFDLLSILLVFLIGRRLFGEWTGILAALLLSLTALHIQLSHYATTDVIVTTLCLAAFYWALRASDGGRWWEYLLAGVSVGLAVASKLSALPIVAVLALPAAEALRLGGWRAIRRAPRLGALLPLLGLALALLAALWTFRIAQPYAFAGPNPFDFRLDPRWTHDIEYWRDVQAGLADMPPAVQWAGRTPILFVVQNLVLWGLGLPLGIAALAALALAAVRMATARSWPPAWQVVLVGWPAFHIVYFGIGFVKTMRYLLPAYPFLVLLAAALLVRIWNPADERRWLRPTWRALPLVVVVVATALYAVAFTGIYTRTSSRIEASAWIFDNIPLGSVLLSEHWDDRMPMMLPDEIEAQQYAAEHEGQAYGGSELELYHVDSEEKLLGYMDDEEVWHPGLVELLDGADYIIMSSNRLYGSIPRLPERYPMTIAYYDMLFSGELGFDLIKTFTSRPSLFGLELNDDNAEEAFTVYDHPKVLIFQKSDAFDPVAVEEKLLTALNANPVVNLRPIDSGKNRLMLEEARAGTASLGATWSDVFDRGDIANRHPIRVWYLALQAMALAMVPLCWRVFRGLPDRGYAVAKTLGFLSAGYVAWLLASLQVTTFGRGVVLAGIAATALVSLAAVWTVRRAFLVDFRARWREILVAEALFLAAFFAFVWFRSLNPDLWHPARGGEKPMEFAYFNAIVRSDHFPPYDPWFAGGYINYYYYGYALLAAVTRLTGVIPSVAFNLGVPTLFALLVLNAWSFVANLLRLLAGELRFRSRWTPLALGLLGPAFVAVIGNLELARRIGSGQEGYPAVAGEWFGLGGLGDVIRGAWRAVVDPRPLPTDGFWAPSRVVEGTINEFPYFTFLFADLHPHLMGLPFTVAALIVALGIVQARRWPTPPPAPPEPSALRFWTPLAVRDWVGRVPRSLTAERVGLMGVAALLTGALYPLNTWDFPTYVIAVASGFAILELLDRPRPEAAVDAAAPAAEAPAPTSSPACRPRWRFTYPALRRAALWTLGTVVLGRLLFLPYFAAYAVPNSGFDPWIEPRTGADQYLIIHGIVLFFFVSFALAEIAASRPRRWNVRLLRPVGIARGSEPDGTHARRLQASLTVASRRASAAPVLVVGSAAAALGALALRGNSLTLLLAAMGLIVAVAGWRRRREPERLVLFAMAGLAIAISLAVERYTLRGDIGRMNTVFKFYLQVWVLFALAAAAGVAILIMRYRGFVSPLARASWLVVAGVLLVAGLAYPAMATPARLDDRFSDMPRTLDGTAYMREAVWGDAPVPGQGPASYPLSGDLDAINWLLDNVEGTPTIVEGITPLYRWGSRVSVYTGLPTVVGWDWHQTQQRPGYGELITRRIEDVNLIYGGGAGFPEIKPLLDQYHVRYIYVGQLERNYYPAAALAKFDLAVQTGDLTVAYQSPSVTIYEYVPAATGTDTG